MIHALMYVIFEFILNPIQFDQSIYHSVNYELEFLREAGREYRIESPDIAMNKKDMKKL